MPGSFYAGKASSIMVGMLLAGAGMTLHDTTKASRSSADIIQEMRAATVIVQTEDGGEGSGWFADMWGNVITAHHVANRKNTSIVVKKSDGKTFKAKVVCENSAEDIAVLKIADTWEKYIKFGDSDKIKMGQDVLVLGNPFGLGMSASRGIISAESRMINGRPFIQYDAATNPGNSGGVVMNSQGEAIGMVDSIYGIRSPFGMQNAGVGFATPARAIQKVLQKCGLVSPKQHHLH